MTKAFSYLRFSTAEQIKGDSLRRQLDAAEAYAKASGLELDSHSYRDLGVSAYRGKNAAEGKLGQFLEAVQAGTIPKGSYLIIENLDRLSRDRIMPALQRFSAILEQGINVVTLNDRRVFTADSLNNLPELMLSLLSMARAHEESAIKSQRISSAWAGKRKRAETGHKITSICPAWLRYENNEFHVIEERATVVRTIYQMASEGVGSLAITRFLNNSGIPPFTKAKGWNKLYVTRILKNIAVIGKFQPQTRGKLGENKRVNTGQPIDRYFPAIVPDDLYYRVRNMKPRVSGKGRRPYANVLGGLASCMICEARLLYVNSGSNRPYRYLYCANSYHRTGCNAKPIPYSLAVSAVYHCLSDDVLDASEFLASAVKSQSSEIAQRLESLKGKIAETETGIANLLDSLQRVPSQALEERLSQLELFLSKQRETLNSLELKARDTSHPEGLEEALAAMAMVALARNDPQEIGLIRTRINAALKRAIDRIDFEYVKPDIIAPQIALAIRYRGKGQGEVRLIVGKKEAPRNDP